DVFVAQCLEIDIASQGTTVESALENLREAIGLFYEMASPAEIRQRVHENVRISEVVVG
ncbi:type II toxin-antitoxin system HicB family antitoxin, partial [Candidatus Poribacteria bacterium]|nr:type II toxin-antitoxin system HicB family antitoxin [Candidatus Poribacteria bacterium]